MRSWVGLLAILAAGLTRPAAMTQDAAGNPAFHPAPQGTQVDLTKSFHARSAWRLVVTEGPPAKDYGGNDAPGALAFCLHQGSSGRCMSEPVTLPLRAPTPDYSMAWEPHYLLAAKVVYPRGPKAAPFLQIVTGSLHSGDGDQIIATQLIAYDADRNAFRRVFGERTGHNNNQEIRFVTGGPLRGSVITAEPQLHLPYGYWISVKSLNPAGAYRQVLRYRSATLYNDSNPIAVIDSEMPNIERRLGLWEPGQRFPTPDVGGGKPCLKPALRNSELWCG